MAINVTKNHTKKILRSPTIFIWSGLNRQGKKIQGKQAADSMITLKAQLRKQGITPIQIKRKPKALFNLGGNKKILPADIAVITRQIATLLEAGIPLVQTLNILNSGHHSHPMRQLLSNIEVMLSSGVPLSDCLRNYPAYFDELYCSLVASGEQSGALSTIYKRIAVYKEKSELLKSKIKKAMLYPMAVLIIASMVISILLLFVVPVFESIFASFDAELPAFTLFFLALSRFMQTYWAISFAVILAVVLLFKRAHQNSQQFRDKVDQLIIRFTIIGPVLEKAAIARYARTLSTTFAAGVPLTDALTSAAGASGNAVFRQAILAIRSEVSAGMPMNLAMRNCRIFPDLVVQMVAIGEESGAVDDMLSKVAYIYEQQVDEAVDGLTTLLEPIIMTVLGIVIGGLIIAMYLPIFEISKII